MQPSNKFLGAHLAHKDMKKRTNLFKATNGKTIENRIKSTVSEGDVTLQKGNLATHNPKVVGSNPASASLKSPEITRFRGFSISWIYTSKVFLFKICSRT